jgi:hypothetical protein
MMEPKNNPNYFRAWSFTMPASYSASYRVQQPSVKQIIAQHDIYDMILADMERFPQAEQMLAAIGIR